MLVTGLCIYASISITLLPTAFRRLTVLHIVNIILFYPVGLWIEIWKMCKPKIQIYFPENTFLGLQLSLKPSVTIIISSATNILT